MLRSEPIIDRQKKSRILDRTLYHERRTRRPPPYKPIGPYSCEVIRRNLVSGNRDLAVPFLGETRCPMLGVSFHYSSSGATLGTYDGRQIISMCVVRIVSSST